MYFRPLWGRDSGFEYRGTLTGRTRQFPLAPLHRERLQDTFYSVGSSGSEMVVEFDEDRIHSIDPMIRILKDLELPTFNIDLHNVNLPKIKPIHQRRNPQTSD